MAMKVAGKRAVRLAPQKGRTAVVPAGRRGAATLLRRRPRGAARSAAGSAESSPSRQELPGLSVALRTVVEGLSPSEIVDFVGAVIGPDTDEGLDASLWGSRPSTTDALGAHLVNLAAKFAARRDVLAHSITRAEAARLLGISNQAVSDRLAAGDLVGLKDGRVWKLPAWQFNADTPLGWLPGVADLRQHFPAGPVTLTAWVTTPNVDLDNHTPAARLAAGDVAQVLRAAQASGPW